MDDTLEHDLHHRHFERSGVFLAWGLAIGIILVGLTLQIGFDSQFPNQRVKELETQIAEASQRLEQLKSLPRGKDTLTTNEQHELQAMQQLVLQKVQDGVPVPLGPLFVEVAELSLIEELERAYLPLLDSPNPYHRLAAAGAFVDLARDRPEQLLAILPKVTENCVYAVGHNLTDIHHTAFSALDIRVDFRREAIAETRKYLKSDDPAIRVGAAELLMYVTNVDLRLRSEFETQLFESLIPVVESKGDSYLVSRSVYMLKSMGPEAAWLIPVLRQRIKRTPSWEQPTYAEYLLEIDSRDKQAIQLLIDAILSDHINARQSVRILVDHVAEAELRQAIDQTVQRRRLSEGKRAKLLSILDVIERNSAAPD